MTEERLTAIVELTASLGPDGPHDTTLGRCKSALVDLLKERGEISALLEETVSKRARLEAKDRVTMTVLRKVFDYYRAKQAMEEVVGEFAKLIDAVGKEEINSS